MAIFDWVESPGTNMEVQAAVLSTRFGDGYEQSAPDGLNAVAEIWNVQFSNIEAQIADQIEAFLKPGLKVERFDWTPPRHTAALRFKCTSFSRSLTEMVGEHSINARFEQVFEP